MKLHPFVSNFIEKHIDIIDQNDYEHLYDVWCNELNSGDPCLFWMVYDALLYAGIDMLLFMETIPGEFFMGYVKDELIIPDNITKIEDCAFRDTQLDRLVIPPSITYAAGYLFQDSFIDVIHWKGNPRLHHCALLGFDTANIETFIITRGSTIDDAMDYFENPQFQISYF